jgi:hypothetical protein
MPLSARGEPITLVSQIDPTTGLPAGLATPSAYTLLTNASATGPAVTNIRGGDYIWRVSGTFAGLTATLQTLDLDGTTYVNVRNQANTADLTFTAVGSIGVGVGQGATVRVLLTGTPSGTPSLNSSLAGLS